MKHIVQNLKSHLISIFILLQIKTKLPKGVEIVGISAGRFHSVFYTNSAVYSFGLNAGQIGEFRCCVWLIHSGNHLVSDAPELCTGN